MLVVLAILAGNEQELVSPPFHPPRRRQRFGACRPVDYRFPILDLRPAQRAMIGGALRCNQNRKRIVETLLMPFSEPAAARGGNVSPSTILLRPEQSARLGLTRRGTRRYNSGRPIVALLVLCQLASARPSQARKFFPKDFLIPANVPAALFTRLEGVGQSCSLPNTSRYPQFHAPRLPGFPGFP